MNPPPGALTPRSSVLRGFALTFARRRWSVLAGWRGFVCSFLLRVLLLYTAFTFLLSRWKEAKVHGAGLFSPRFVRRLMTINVLTAIYSPVCDSAGDFLLDPLSQSSAVWRCGVLGCRFERGGEWLRAHKLLPAEQLKLAYASAEDYEKYCQ